MCLEASFYPHIYSFALGGGITLNHCTVKQEWLPSKSGFYQCRRFCQCWYPSFWLRSYPLCCHIYSVCASFPPPPTAIWSLSPVTMSWRTCRNSTYNLSCLASPHPLESQAPKVEPTRADLTAGHLPKLTIIAAKTYHFLLFNWSPILSHSVIPPHLCSPSYYQMIWTSFWLMGCSFQRFFMPDPVLNQTSFTVFIMPIFSHIHQSINQSITMSKIGTLGRACPLDPPQVGIQPANKLGLLSSSQYIFQ